MSVRQSNTLCCHRRFCAVLFRDMHRHNVLGVLRCSEQKWGYTIASIIAYSWTHATVTGVPNSLPEAVYTKKPDRAVLGVPATITLRLSSAAFWTSRCHMCHIPPPPPGNNLYVYRAQGSAPLVGSFYPQRPSGRDMAADGRLPFFPPGTFPAFLYPDPSRA